MKDRRPGGVVEPLNSNPYLVLAVNQIHVDGFGQAAAVRRPRGSERCEAIGKRKDLRRGCRSQSMRSRGREGDRARTAQTVPHKRVRVLGARSRTARAVRQTRARRRADEASPVRARLLLTGKVWMFFSFQRGEENL